MPAKIRLARHGRKSKPFYHLVVADSRAPRDGRYIERIGSYNPNTNPATIDIKFDRALYWLQVGAQPTDTCRNILSYEGVLLKNHLLKGVQKGALTEEEVETRFTAWKIAKEEKIQAKREKIATANTKEEEKAFAKETEIRATREKKLAKKNSELARLLGVKAEAEVEASAEEAQVAETEATTEEKSE